MLKTNSPLSSILNSVFISIFVYVVAALFGPACQAQIVIDHTCTDISQVDVSAVEEAKTKFRIWYGHTSHGSQITTGIEAMNADPFTYNEDGIGGALSYQENDGVDLGEDGNLGWVSITREILDRPDNDRNVILWSWCGGVSGNTPQGINTYLQAMDQLERDYPNVIFVYMTGHLDGSGLEGDLHANNDQIREFCREYQKVLFDFADIESYDPDGNEFLSLYANDNCDYIQDGQERNWAQEWCAANPGACPSCQSECAHSQCLNCILKGRAFWRLMAELVDWNPSIVPQENIFTEANFPDPNFRAAVAEWMGIALNGTITAAQAAGMGDWFDCSYRNIENMKGLEFFTRLTGLACDGNQLTALDISKNTALNTLSCYENQLTLLDVSNNTALEYLYCSYNSLTSIDVSKNTALLEFGCDDNSLTALDLSNNTALNGLYCGANRLTVLDVSNNPELIWLNCGANSLTLLDISKNPSLIDLSCWANELTNIDVTQNPALEYLFCDENQLTSVDVSQCTDLVIFGCSYNPIATIDLSNNPALEELYCDGCELSNLNLSNNIALSWLSCGENQLQTLDVSKNTVLELLYCPYNLLTSLDISKNTALTELYCDGNELTALDISKNAALTMLYCGDNPFGNLDLSHNPGLIELACDGTGLKALDVSPLTSLSFLSCSYNELTALDVSKNLVLEYLYCEENLLTDLDVSQNQQLLFLSCPYNQLTSLSSMAANQNFGTGGIVDVRYNNLDCGDWGDVVILRERIGQIILDEWEGFASGFAYSPQNDMDPFDCATPVFNWSVY